ncbi:glycosyltransferase [Arenimonas sp.]|uniref:glycosyltransferase family 4 protein n=1 Tax=Arenimonas sp. TaxID=1872635 RepID=UPI0025B97AB1|nr:glycosyltransferase [Arenimonas sp.]
MSSVDPESSSLRRPWTLLRPVRVGARRWIDIEIPHVGARYGELEFQRYRPREALSGLVGDCDVIQVVCGSPAWANAVLGLGKPVSLQVATLARVERRMRDGTGRGAAATWRRAMTRITNRMDERALRRVDAIQLENPWMLEHTQRANLGRAGVDIRYAPPGVDAAVFHPDPARNPASGHILCVGRLDDPRKNIGLLLETYALLPQAMRDRHRLVLAGAGGPPSSFWQRAVALGLQDRVEFIHRPDQGELVALYQQAAVFALTSDEEGLGVVVLEAMACAVPVVSTRSGGPDGILTNGVDGRLVPLDDAAAMANALAYVLADPAANAVMGLHARATIDRSYAQVVAGRAFLDVWNRLASGATACVA